MRKKFDRLHPGSRYPSRSSSSSFAPDAVVSLDRRHLRCFDRSKVAPANTSETPQSGKDPRAVTKYPIPNENPCDGCRFSRPRNDWSHNRTIGTCYFPFDEPKIWDCDACMHHLPRYHAGHTGGPGECKWEYYSTPGYGNIPGNTAMSTNPAAAETPVYSEGGESHNVSDIFPPEAGHQTE